MTDPVTHPGRLELSAPAQPEILDLVHAMIAHLWETNASVVDHDRNRFETAVVEILGNIVEHAYELVHQAPPPPADEARRFHVCLSATDVELLATFGDNGLPTQLDLEHVAMPDEFAESGRGLALAAAAVDEMAYERVGDRNHWRLRCVRSAH